MTQDEIDNGGPVLPQTYQVGDVSKTVGGMTLRDYFAGQALIALISNDQTLNPMITAANGIDVLPIIAKASYKLADAMLKARKK